MSLIDSRTTRILFTVLVFAVGFAFLYVARRTLIAFLFAIFFAYLVDPAVSRVEKLMKSRGLAITVIYLMIVIALGTLFFFIGPRIGHEVQKLTESMPTVVERINSGQIVQDIGIEHGVTKTTRDQLSAFLKAHTSDLLRVAQRVGLRVAEAAQESWILILIPILAAFFLKDGQAFSQAALSFVHSKPKREFLQDVLNDMNLMLAQFIRAQLTLAALSWVAYASFLGLIMHVPYALMLGTAGGLLEFIPVVGPLVASLLIIGVALLTGYPYWIIVGIFLIFWRLIQDYVVAPRVMGRTMQLHPLAAIFGVLAGGEIAGVLGVYLSIPVMASLRIVWRRWRMYAEKRRFGPLNEYSFLTESSQQP